VATIRTSLLRTRSFRTAVVAAVVSSVSLLAFTGTSSADPKPTIAQVQAQLDALSQQAEVAQEKANDAQVAVAAAQRKLAQVQARVAKSQAVVDQARKDVGALASAAYRSGGLDQTLELLLADDPTQFLAQATALDNVSRRQSDVLRAAAVAEQRLTQDKLAAAQELAAIAQLRAQLAQQLAAVNQQKAATVRLLASLTAQQQAELAAARAAAVAKARAEAQAEARRTAQAQRPTRTSTRRSGGGGGPSTYSGTIGQKVVAYALNQVGDSYVWGATGPSAFDCSGLTMAAYRVAGISLPHSSSAQYSSYRHVSRSQLQPGDLVFYYSPIHHVAIYIGGGRIVHAANPSSGVLVADLYSMPFSGAARPY
jgi:cell wall-associated NlpC family hydrolase